MYFAVIGDMVASKKLRRGQRAAAQETLADVLSNLNLCWEGSVAANFTITLGDEFQGLLHGDSDAVSAALLLLYGMRRYPVRLAVGFGDIHTQINPAAAIGADGPAFHNARRMIESMKARHGARLRFALPDERVQRELNIVAALCDKLAEEWTDKQALAVHLMLMSRLRGERLTQTGLAALLNVSQPTVNDQLSAAGFNEYCAAMLYIKERLAEYAKGSVI